MTRPQSDAGFTLVELLVVLVIMPLVIGAIAAAIIISYQDSGVASSRLSDSASAEIASEYYTRDVQGAQYVTTSPLASSPAVCVNPKLPSPTLVLGLYRPAGSTSTALSAGYWVTGGPNPQLVRDSCSVSPGTLTLTLTDEVPFTSEVDPASVTATIVPSQFAAGAKVGWTPTTATTQTTAASANPPSTLQVVSTNGFLNGNIGVRSTAGYQTMACTAAPPTTFNCSGGSGQVAAGAQIRQQDSISNVSLSATESGSGYTYSLQATPREWATRLSGKFGPGAPFAAALVTLDNAGVSLTGGSIQVNGAASIGGPLTATGTASLSAQAAVNTNGPVACVSGGVVTAGPTSASQCGHIGGTPTTDPLGPIVAGATPQGLSSQPCPSFSAPTTTLSPGIYTCELNIPAFKQVFLNPGVYELQYGLAVALASTVAMTANPNGGALLYLTCPTGQSSCTEPASFQSGAVVSIAPLSASQSTAYFPTLGTPALQDLWLWQVSSNSAPVTLLGNNLGGAAYLPGAMVDLSNNKPGASIGRIVAGNITMSSGSLTVTGQ